MRTFRGEICVAVGAISFVLGPAGLGQRPYSRVEAGIGSDSQTFSDRSNGDRFVSTGIGGVATWNLSASVAVEGNGSFLPVFQKAPYLDAGRESTLFGGVKAGRRIQRWDFSGKVEPGFISFSCGLSYIGPGGTPFFQCSRRTHFALEVGGVAGYQLSARNLLRADVGQTLIAEFDQVLGRNGSAVSGVAGHIAQHFDYRFSLEHTFGSMHDDEREQAGAGGTFDVGVLDSLQIKEHLTSRSVSGDSGIGLWVSKNFTRHYSWDTSAFELPRDDRSAGFQDGGSSLIAVTGLKAGIRMGPLGVFGKVRPGAILFSRTVDRQTVTDSMLVSSYSKFPDFLLDTGGIVEICLSRHAIIRTEAGDATLLYRTKVTTFNGISGTIPSTQRASVLFLFGAGYRF